MLQEAEIKKIAQQNPFNVEDVQWVHDNLEAVHQNAKAVQAVLNFARSISGSISYLKLAKKQYGTISNLV